MASNATRELVPSAGQENGTRDLHTDLAVAERLPQDLALLKMENEQIFTIARLKPRDWASVTKQLDELIRAYPEAAKLAIYKKPVGTVYLCKCANEHCLLRFELTSLPRNNEPIQCPRCEGSAIQGKPEKRKKFAEGLSIRAAESIRSILGFTRLSTQTELDQDGRATLRGVIVDYCTGNLSADERVLSPFYKSRYGRMERTPEDRFLNVVIKAEKSKLKRDLILDITPNIVKACFRDACEKILMETAKPELIEKNVLPYFQQKGLSLENLEYLVGRPLKLGWTQADISELRKIKAALETEETTVAELLADQKEDVVPATPGPTSAADLTNPKEKAPEPSRPAENQGMQSIKAGQEDKPAAANIYDLAEGRQPGEDDDRSF
jgi:hypothetical protein